METVGNVAKNETVKNANGENQHAGKNVGQTKRVSTETVGRSDHGNLKPKSIPDRSIAKQNGVVVKTSVGGDAGRDVVEAKITRNESKLVKPVHIDDDTYESDENSIIIHRSETASFDAPTCVLLDAEEDIKFERMADTVPSLDLLTLRTDGSHRDLPSVLLVRSAWKKTKKCGPLILLGSPSITTKSSGASDTLAGLPFYCTDIDDPTIPESITLSSATSTTDIAIDTASLTEFSSFSSCDSTGRAGICDCWSCWKMMTSCPAGRRR